MLVRVTVLPGSAVPHWYVPLSPGLLARSTVIGAVIARARDMDALKPPAICLHIGILGLESAELCQGGDLYMGIGLWEYAPALRL